MTAKASTTPIAGRRPRARRRPIAPEPGPIVALPNRKNLLLTALVTIVELKEAIRSISEKFADAHSAQAMLTAVMSLDPVDTAGLAVVCILMYSAIKDQVDAFLVVEPSGSKRRVFWHVVRAMSPFVGFGPHRGKMMKMASMRVIEGKSSEFRSALVKVKKVFAASGRSDALLIYRGDKDTDQHRIVLLGQNADTAHEEQIIKSILGPHARSFTFSSYHPYS